MAEKSQDKPQDQELGQIREIIFGRQMRDYEARFSRLQEDVARRTQDVRSTLEDNLAALKTAFDQRGKSDEETFDAVRASIDELRRTAEARLNDLDVALDQLRSDAAGDLAKLRDELTAAAAEADAKWQARTDQLNSDKVDRGELSGLLNELSRQLAGGRADANGD